MRLVRARQRIHRAKCTVGGVRRLRSGRRIGKVVAQSPRSGVKRPKGFRVRLVVGARSR
jgi:hypothetical protein